MDIMRLRQRKADLIKEQKAIFDAAAAEDRTLSDKEKERDDAIAAELETLSGDLARAERQQETERELAAIEATDDRLAQATLASARCGFDNLADFALSVMRASDQGGAVMDPRLSAMYQAQPANFHQEQGAAEGYMVPPEFRETIWQLVFADEAILATVDMEPTSQNSVGIIKDESTPWGSSGVQANWRVEASKMTASKLDTKQIFLQLNELFAFVLATEELLQDAPRLNTRLTTKAAQAIRWKADDAVVNGDGVGKMLGWTKSAALVSVAKEGGQAADTIQTENVAKMFSRMLPMGLGRAYWLLNSDALPQIMTMVIGQHAIWTPPNGFIAAPAGLLLGRPLRLSEHAQTLGDKGDIQFIDPLGYYATRKQQGVEFAESMHLFFDYNMRAFRWVFRLAGQPYLSAPVTPPNSPTTKSHFVVLDERA